MFHTNYDTSSDKFQNYYKDVSLRMKNKELDILIVVNMFLTGFDATTMNTLWVENARTDTGVFPYKPYSEFYQDLWKYCMFQKSAEASR